MAMLLSLSINWTHDDRYGPWDRRDIAISSWETPSNQEGGRLSSKAFAARYWRAKDSEFARVLSSCEKLVEHYIALVKNHIREALEAEGSVGIVTIGATMRWPG